MEMSEIECNGDNSEGVYDEMKINFEWLRESAFVE